MNTQTTPVQADVLMDPGFGWDLAGLADMLRRRWWVTLLITLSALAFGVIYLLTTPPIFEATTVVQIDQQERAVVSVRDEEREDFKTADVLKTIEQNLASSALLLRVAKNLKLDQTAAFTNEKPGAAARFFALFGQAKAEPPSNASLLRNLNSRIKVSLRRGTRLIDITVSGQDPELARLLSQTIVTEYTKLNFEQKLEASKPVREHLVSEAERLKQRLEMSEQKLQTYREQQHAVSLDQTQNIVVETLRDLNTSLGQARGNRIKIESDVAAIAALQARPMDLLAVAGIGSAPDVMALKQRISEQEASLASLAERYDAKHPNILQARSQLQQLNQSLAKAAENAAGQVKASLSASTEAEQKLMVALREQETRSLELNKIAIQYNVLLREADSDRALYDAVLKQLKETQIIESVELGAIRIVEPATLPDRASSPKKSMVLGLAMAMGLLLGIVVGIAPAVLRAPLLAVDDGERQLGIPSLAVIPKLRIRQGPLQVFFADFPNSPASESVRSLRATLGLLAHDGKGRTFLFCGAEPSEGKTFCAINFAASLALEGHRTLLIDADLRLPSVGSHFFGKQPEKGLAEVLQKKATLQAAIRDSKLEHLKILTAGVSTGHAAELLGAAAFGEMMAEALELFDRVVVDSPPVMMVSDALRIASQVQHVCLVVKAGVTPGRSVSRAQHLLAKAAGSPLAGFILNQAAGTPVGYGTYGSYS